MPVQQQQRTNPAGQTLQQALKQTATKTRPKVSAPALHAARTVLQNYTLTPKPVPGRQPALAATDEFSVAVIIDVTTNVCRLEPFRKETAELFKRVCGGTATVDEVKKFLYDLGVALNRLPTYG